MELGFDCPLTGKDFLTKDWEIRGELQLEEDPQGTRMLRGKVVASCPYCQTRHVYRAEELVCPLTQT